MATLDLVVTSDTSIAHLAGALGRPVLVALKHAADWRWLRDRDDSPWYPTMRLFRQTRKGDWDGVLERIAAWVEPLAAARNVMRHVRWPATRISVPVFGRRAHRQDHDPRDQGKPNRGPGQARQCSARARAAADGPLGGGARQREACASWRPSSRTVNAQLWQLEDTLRAHEARGGFDAELVDLARQVSKIERRRVPA